MMKLFCVKQLIVDQKQFICMNFSIRTLVFWSFTSLTTTPSPPKKNTKVVSPNNDYLKYYSFSQFHVNRVQSFLFIPNLRLFLLNSTSDEGEMANLFWLHSHVKKSLYVKLQVSVTTSHKVVRRLKKGIF